MSADPTAPGGASVKAPEPNDVGTEYVVLVMVVATASADAEGGATAMWRLAGKTTARSAEAATKKYAEDNPPKTGESLTLVAVAAARWSPQTFKSRTVTTVEAV